MTAIDDAIADIETTAREWRECRSRLEAATMRLHDLIVDPDPERPAPTRPVEGGGRTYNGTGRTVEGPRPVATKAIGDAKRTQRARRNWSDEQKKAGADLGRRIGVGAAAGQLDCAQSLIRQWMRIHPAQGGEPVAPSEPTARAHPTHPKAERPAPSGLPFERRHVDPDVVRGSQADRMVGL